MGELILLCYIFVPPTLIIWSILFLNKRMTRPNIALFCILLITGLVVGGYFGFQFEYYSSPTVRHWSFPIPGATFVLEDEEWVDYINNFLLVVPFTNMLCMTAPFMILFVSGNLLYGLCTKHHKPSDANQ